MVNSNSVDIKVTFNRYATPNLPLSSIGGHDLTSNSKKLRALLKQAATTTSNDLNAVEDKFSFEPPLPSKMDFVLKIQAGRAPDILESLRVKKGGLQEQPHVLF